MTSAFDHRSRWQAVEDQDKVARRSARRRARARWDALFGPAEPRPPLTVEQRRLKVIYERHPTTLMADYCRVRGYDPAHDPNGAVWPRAVALDDGSTDPEGAMRSTDGLQIVVPDVRPDRLAQRIDGADRPDLTAHALNEAKAAAERARTRPSGMDAYTDMYEPAPTASDVDQWRREL